MAYINDKNLPYLVEKLSNADNIKINNNKHGSRVSTVINSLVTKSDNVTKALEQEVINDSYSFKVGTGNVDVSTDIQDGFGEVGVKGVTYQNVLPVGMFDSKENFYALGGQVSDLHSSFDGGYITLNATGSYGNAFVKLEKTLLKQNSKYTLILDIKNTNLTLKEEIDSTTPSFAVASAHPSEAFVEWCFLGGNEYPLKNGIQKFLLTTKSDFTGVNWSTRMFISDKVASGSITFRFLLLEGDHTNNPNLPSYFDSFVHVGSIGKNLFNINDTIEGYIGWNNSILPPDHNNLLSNYIKVKPNTRYTYSIGGYDKPTNIDHWTGWTYYKDKHGTISTIVTDRQSRTGPDDSYKTMSFTTPSDCNYIRIGSRHLSLSNAWAQLEGSEVATPYEPFTYKVEILSHGKNLYKPNLQTKSSNGLTFSLHGNTLIVNGTCTKIVDFRPINGTESITLELYNYVNKLPVGTTLKLSNNLGLKNFFSLKRNGAQTYPANTLIIQEGDYGISCFVRFEEGQSYNNAELKIQLEINNVATEFEPYQEDKTQILLDEPLVRLPNGVCDEITRDGILIRRVGKIVFTGIESWNLSKTSDNTILFEVGVSNIKIDKRGNILPMCDKLLASLQSNIWNNDIEGVSYTDNINNRFRIRINKNRLNTQDLTGFKQWLSQNPTTVYYELAEPIATELPAPCLRIFKDGHITFNTLVAPESNHVVQLNKSAQIERSIREVQSLNGRVGQLESFYDNMMLETSYKLNLLNYDFKYTKEREDE